MFSKEKNYIGVSLSEDALRMAVFKVSPAEQKVGEIIKRDVRGVSEEELSKTVHSALSLLNAKKAQAVCVIPSNLVTTKNIEIPSIDPEEIRSIIDLQAGRHTPYSREEILVGYITIGVFQRNYTKVLLVIANRAVIKKQMGVFESAGIKIDKVLFAPETMARFYSRFLNVKPEDVPIGIIDVTHQTTNFTVEFNATVATCRSIPVGLSHLVQEGVPARDKLIGELIKSVEVYQNEDINKMPEVYVLTGTHEKIKELEPILKEKLKANIKFAPYADFIQGNPLVNGKLTSEYSDDSFLDVMSAVLTRDQSSLDLTPEEIKIQRTIEEKGKELIKAGIFAIILLILVCAIFFSKIYFRNVVLTKVETDYLQKRKAVIALDRVAQRTQIIKDYVTGRMVSLDVLTELYALVPDEIYLEEILLDENGSIVIRGVSESMSRVFNLVTALEESDLFKGVKTKSTTAKKDRGKDVAAFEIVFKLESAKDGEDAEEGEEAPPSGAKPSANGKSAANAGAAEKPAEKTK